MSFTSWPFGIFAAMVFAIYYLPVLRAFQVQVLVAASLVFYGYGQPELLPMLARATPADSFGDVGFNNLNAGDEATDTLMRGFTTVRDVGGPVFGLKHAIDEGIVRGPRIYPSGAMITITSTSDAQ
jgi:hypothetical protein